MLTADCLGQDEFQSESLAQAALPSRPISLWLVDDNRRLRATLAELFQNCEGVRCTGSFASPNAVLSALASRVGPDVILLDVNMGDANGVDAIRPIKSLSRSTQVLMLTTFFDSQIEQRALSSGASGFLLKSFPMDKILNSIRQAWRKPAPHLKQMARETAGPAPESNASAGREAASTSISSDAPVAHSGDGPRKRLLWIKHCLDLIRNSRN